MARIKSMDMRSGKIELTLSISNDEYKILRQNTSSLIILPSGNDSLPYSLTTGKLGNSNRVMLPKKILESFNIFELNKKVPSNIFQVGGESFMLIKIDGSKIGIPKFKEE